jgi:Sulfotransferase family
MISVQKNFIFIHVPKTGGTSVRAALHEWGVHHEETRSRRLLSMLPLALPPTQASLRVHDQAWWVRRKVARDFFEEAFKFAVVRNPYDLALSYWTFLRANPSSKRHAEATAWDAPGFIAYLERKHSLSPVSQTAWLTRRGDRRRGAGPLLTDAVLRFESLPQDFADLARHLAIPHATLPHLNVTSHGDWRDVFGEREARIIQRIYAADFERFGYAR